VVASITQGRLKWLSSKLTCAVCISRRLNGNALGSLYL
jgi:hypothetical protein